MRGPKRVEDARERAYDPRIHLLGKKSLQRWMDCNGTRPRPSSAILKRRKSGRPDFAVLSPATTTLATRSPDRRRFLPSREISSATSASKPARADHWRRAGG